MKRLLLIGSFIFGIINVYADGIYKKVDNNYKVYYTYYLLYDENTVDETTIGVGYPLYRDYIYALGISSKFKLLAMQIIYNEQPPIEYNLRDWEIKSYSDGSTWIQKSFNTGIYWNLDHSEYGTPIIKIKYTDGEKEWISTYKYEGFHTEF